MEDGSRKEDLVSRVSHKAGPGSSAQPDGASRDVLAIGVLVAALVLLLVSGYFALGQLSRGDVLSPGKTIAEWMETLEEFGQDLLAGLPAGFGSRSDPKQAAERHLRKGYRYYTRNRLNDALEECAEAIRLNPADAHGHYWRGRVHLRLRKYDPALEDFLTAVRLNPDYREAHDNLGWLYERQNRYEDALRHLSRSIELAQDNSWAYYHRAVVQYRRGEMARALEDARKACQLKNQDGCRLYEEYRKKSGKT